MKLEKINESKIKTQEEVKSNSLVEKYLQENKIFYEKVNEDLNVKITTREELGKILKFLKESKLKPRDLTMIKEEGFRYKFKVNESVKEDENKKLPDAIPSEPIVVSSEPQEETKKVEDKEMSNVLVGMVNDLIRGEFDSIDKYNSMIVTLESMGYKGSDKLISIFNDILNEENIHVGQLQEALMLVSPHAKDIEAGKEEAQEVLASVESSKEEDDINKKKEEEEEK